jgi:hypothetical protein
MYNPGTQVQIPTDVNLGSYYLLKKLTMGVSPTAFLSKKKCINFCIFNFYIEETPKQHFMP